jgi:hypothetical protein
LVWSFGNNGKDYLYGADIEDMKHAYHKAVYEGDIDALKPYGYKLSKSFSGGGIRAIFGLSETDKKADTEHTA